MVAYHDRNGAARRPQILGWLGDGHQRRLCVGRRDAADRRSRLPAGRGRAAAGHAVHAVPGASALLAALSVAGLPTDRFLFLGFLPPRSSARQTRRCTRSRACGRRWSPSKSPRRLAATLADMAAVLGEDRPAAVARELTKRFEEVRRDRSAPSPPVMPARRRGARSSSWSVRRRRERRRPGRGARRSACRGAGDIVAEGGGAHGRRAPGAAAADGLCQGPGHPGLRIQVIRGVRRGCGRGSRGPIPRASCGI